MAFTPGKSRKVIGVLGAVLVALVVLALTAGAFVTMAGSAGDSINAQLKTDPSKSATPSPKPTPTHTPVCSNSWPMVTTTHLKNRWFAEGIASIFDAKTNADAVAAAPDFTEKVSQEASLLVGAAKAFHLPDVDVATLTDNKGCATDATVKLKIALDVARATARSITLGEAPVNGTNTGVQNGQVVSDPGGTISGNRKAIKIVLADGSTIWIMARCGNIVTSGPPIFPPGKTDNPPCTDKCTPPIIHVCLPPTPHGTWPLCKDGSIVAPSTDTTAPTGGGNSVVPGPGAPTQIVVLPATPYTPPPAPIPAIPQPQPTLDPAPAPSVEPSAAPAPVTPCLYAPGDTPC